MRISSTGTKPATSAQLLDDEGSHHQPDEELRKSEWRLRYATESAGLTYVEVDLVRRQARTPANFAAVMGYVPPPEQEQDISAGSRMLLAHVVPEDRARVAAAHEAFLDGTTSGMLDYRVLGDDQIERWIETRWSVELAVDGKPLRSFATNLDITERKRAGERVRASEERYKDLFDAIDEGFCVLEMIYDDRGQPIDWRYLETNQSFEKQSGMRAVEGKRVSEVLTVDPDWLAVYGGVARTGEPVRFVLDIPELHRWFDIYAFRIGQPEKYKVAVVFNDITKRQQAEIALQESEERYRTLFNSMDEGFCTIEVIVDGDEQPIDYRFLETNPAFEKQTGLSDATGKRMRELVPTLEQHWFDIYGKVARTGESIRFVNVAKDISGRWFDTYACRVGPPSSRKVAIVFNDVTVRRQVEEDLRASEKRLRFVMDSMPQKVVTTTPDGVADYFNPQWSEFTGLSLQQITDGGWAQLLHPDDLAEAIRRRQHAVATGEPNRHEQRLRRADGEYRWHLSLAAPMRDATGEITMWIGSVTDVHEAKEADRRKDEFLAMLAHELRNPLAPVCTTVEVLKHAGDNPQILQPALTMMERQLRHLTRLIDDLLDASRISQGKIGLRREKVDLTSVVAHTVEAARPSYEAAQQALTVTLPPPPVYVDADPVRLAQVFGNLLHNASKFSASGGQVSLAVELQGDDVVVSVKDRGVGMPAALVPRVFELFMQGDQTLERTHSGLGIGLTLVRTLVQMHGGSVQALSDGVGRGSTFVVQLPLHETDDARATNQQPTTATVSTTRRVLIADDNRDAAEMLSMLLGLQGHETEVVFNGAEAVAATERFRPDVILLDIGMPVLNGFEAARQIRQQPWSNGVVLVALTGWGQHEDRGKTAAAGFDDHLLKPLDLEALKELLARLPTSTVAPLPR